MDSSVGRDHCYAVTLSRASFLPKIIRRVACTVYIHTCEITRSRVYRLYINFHQTTLSAHEGGRGGGGMPLNNSTIKIQQRNAGVDLECRDRKKNRLGGEIHSPARRFAPSRQVTRSLLLLSSSFFPLRFPFAPFLVPSPLHKNAHMKFAGR